jgi:hypothetical protein
MPILIAPIGISPKNKTDVKYTTWYTAIHSILTYKYIPDYPTRIWRGHMTIPGVTIDEVKTLLTTSGDKELYVFFSRTNYLGSKE